MQCRCCRAEFFTGNCRAIRNRVCDDVRCPITHNSDRSDLAAVVDPRLGMRNFRAMPHVPFCQGSSAKPFAKLSENKMTEIDLRSELSIPMDSRNNEYDEYDVTNA